MAIRPDGFRNRGLSDLFLRGRTRRIGTQYHRNVLLILDFLNAATELSDCRGVKDFHQLRSPRRGTYSMHVTGNYCITFRFDGEFFTDLDFEDYH
ncbi:MAG: type II toxin-antitoxin system RelE/ParE family toxin [Alphaproteobacteria bacterium]|nr:type II toxin-antitoxin system RelE/ParE family toxin [Alphaproteobacteria bacterium]